ncbi:alpha/beta hydrolase [Nonomuraea diastatica]|uniref:alpha/beta hydrolase n=1 Tax=Nonomuraea diastatica TaxID=1848329 RepID=UPI001C70A1D0|nr:alpha/beta hydrolase [Nonomuraea diastatica]
MRSGSGIRIALREVWAPGRGRDLPPVLLLHGARVPGEASFDLPVDGGSLAADLALAGHRVHIMDARGYGASTRPAEMDDPPLENPPLATGVDVVQDVAAAVRGIQARSRRRAVALVGWATGAHWLGWYASRYPGAVSHLVFYNSLYGAVDGHPTLGRGSQYEDPERPGEFNTGKFGAYRLSTGESLIPSWDSSIPVEDKTQWRDPNVVDAYVRLALASDPTSEQRQPPSFRAPTGALSDSFYLAIGRKLWHAGTITAKTLIVRSELDFWSREEDVPTLKADLRRAQAVRTVTLEQATHYTHLDREERGRGALIKELTTWLGSRPARKHGFVT